jgi:hypothetical protein
MSKVRLRHDDDRAVLVIEAVRHRLINYHPSATTSLAARPDYVPAAISNHVVVVEALSLREGDGLGQRDLSNPAGRA